MSCDVAWHQLGVCKKFRPWGPYFRPRTWIFQGGAQESVSQTLHMILSITWTLMQSIFDTSDPGILAHWRMEVLQVWTRGQGVDSVKEGTERHRGCVWRVLEILVWNVLGNTTVEVWPWLWVTEAKCKWKWFLTSQGYEIGLRPPSVQMNVDICPVGYVHYL